MNAVEIEEAVSALVAEPFDGEEFPYQFLAAFGFKETTLKKLKSGAANTTDVPGAVLLRSNVHLIVTPPGQTSACLAALKASQRTAKGKCKFVFATDGEMVEAEELATGELLACRYTEIPNHFGFFLPLAGISTVAEIKDNPIDIRATGRLNKLYVQLLKDNEGWASDAKRPALNQFMSRLIFCFFAEDTGIFTSEGLFTACVKQMSDETNTQDVIKELFRAMNTHPDSRKAANIRPFADPFPYVNGGLFSNEIDCPRFSKIARSYLLRVGELNWKEINPDIFGSMIQAVADDDERGSLGMHYTSVPNILKVLDPLFLDDLREQLEEAADNPRKLLNLRKRIAAIRVFDPACGSGNFLVIAYIKLREIEAEIIRRRKDDDRRSWIKLTNFYGIEIKSFAAEIARLALLIAEFQCNVRFIGQREACLDVLPLHDTGQIVNGNALRLDWLKVCQPNIPGDQVEADLGGPTGRLALEVEPTGETYICGNPPYRGSTWQTPEQKADLQCVAEACCSGWKSLDYVAGWLLKACEYGQSAHAAAAFVSTNSICQGQQVELLWPLIFKQGFEISFAYASFRWTNLASQKAGVTVIIVGLAKKAGRSSRLFNDADGTISVREVAQLNPYLVPGPNITVAKRPQPLSKLPTMDFGSKPVDGGNLLLSQQELEALALTPAQRTKFVRRILGSAECIRGLQRYCLWIDDESVAEARGITSIACRLDAVRSMRLASPKQATVAGANTPHRFDERRQRGGERVLVVPSVSSETRQHLPVDYMPPGTIVSNLAFGLFDAPLWNLALIASRLHLVWIATVCGKMKTDFRYSNTLGWNTFPVPSLTENDKAALTHCAEDILLAREAHFPATIADLYDSETMPADLRAAHERNDESLERMYIGRRFKNDTERLEKLFDMYTKMIKDEEAKGAKSGAKSGRKAKQTVGEADAS
jgi:hypothetical protein